MGDTEKQILARVKWGHSFKNFEDVRRTFDDPDDEFGFNHYDYSCRAERYPAPQIMFDLVSQIIHIEKDTPGKSSVIDFACGTGLSGVPYMDLGIAVDGIDISEEMLKKAQEKRYRKTWRRNLATDDVDDIRGHNIAICLGALGEYIPPEIVIPKMVATLDETALIAFTSEETHTDIAAVEKQLREFGFIVSHKSVKPGYIDDELGEDHFYVIAIRSKPLKE